MYADDTTIYFNLEDFTHELREAESNAELEIVKDCLKLNKLTLNTNKTKLAEKTKWILIENRDIYLS